MIDTVFLGRQDVADDAGQIPGIGRGTDLVIDDADLFLLPAQMQHGADEIAAVFAVNPAGAQDKIAGHQGTDGVLTLDLAHAIDIQRAVGIVNLEGLISGAREDIVR